MSKVIPWVAKARRFRSSFLSRVIIRSCMDRLSSFSFNCRSLSTGGGDGAFPVVPAGGR